MTEKNQVFCSVIIPVYNTEKYLHQCLDSVLNQTFRDFELIIVDDGSTDNSAKICDEYSDKDQRIRLIHQTNGGHTKARKVGLSLATGKYVFFVDSDDWLELDALQIINENVKKTGADIITFDSYFCHKGKQVKYHQSAPAGFYDKKAMIESIYPKMIYSGRFFYFGVYASMWNKVFLRSILTPNLLNVDERIRIGEDGLATFATFLDASSVCVLAKKYLYDYRDDNISITRSYYPELFNNTNLLIDKLRQMNKKKNIYDLDSQIDYYYLYNIYSIFIEEFYYKYKKSIFQKFKNLKNIYQDHRVMEVLDRVSFDDFKDSHLTFFKILQSRHFYLLVVFSIFIAMKKRFIEWVRKILGKN